MKMRKLALYALLASWAFVQFGCGKDDSPSNPDDGLTEALYNITQATINTDGYTAPGELSFWYSIDNGESYSIEKPEDLSKGDELWVKINNGEVDIYEEDFYFDWSGSSLAPADAESDLAKFVVKESDITLVATVTDRMELLVSDRDTGQFYVLDVSDGGLTPAFSLTEDGETLLHIKSVVYNYNDSKIYASTYKFGSSPSSLFSIDPSNLQATLINGNDDMAWHEISDIVISANHSIIATMEIEYPYNYALYEFDTLGNVTESMDIEGDDIPCCWGVGLSLGANDGELLIGTSLSNPFKIYKSNLDLSEIETVELLLEGFSNTNSVNYSTMNLVKDANGAIYALLLEDVYEGNTVIMVNTHIANIDLENNTLNHISTITADSYSGLAFIPAYAF